MVELFSIISNGLKRAGVVLFFLWDNFEKVVSSPNVDPKHMTFLRTMGEVPNAASSIRFVFSGSNYLLEAVSIKQGNDSWNEILSRCSTAIKIGNLCYEDFTALMCQKRALNDGQIHYCPEAVEYLWKYTNGHAFYSCLLGNRTLDILSRRRVKRDCIYPSDVYIAIYKSQEYMANDTLDTSKENAIEKQIFQDIADNIAVKYVGKTLAQRIIKGAESMSHKKLQDMVTRKRPDISDKNFGMALEILQARDFVHKVNGKGVAYAFTSDLYLERFSSIEVHELTVQEVESIEQKKKDIYDFMRDMSMDEIERLRKLMGNQFSSAGDTTFVATGATNIGTQNNVQINNLKIDQISNSVQGLVELAKKKRFQAAEVEELIEVLPRLELRPSEDVDEQVDEMAKFDTDVYCENLEKGVEKSDVSLEQWVQGEGQAFLMNQGVDVDRLKALGRGYYNSVIVAMYLRDLFGKIQMFSRTVHLDFAPVTILLCKAVERMLTEKHLPLYQDPEIWVNKVRANTPESGTPQQRIVFSKSTIGTFTTAMQAMFDIPEGDSEKQAKEENRDRFLARTRATEQEWKVYLMDLIEAKDIRNMTAHANPVSQQDCDKIITKLFPLELLDHTVDYVE